METNFVCLIAGLAVMSAVFAQNSTENNTSLQWLNSLLLVPNVDMQNEMLAASGNAVNLNPQEVVPKSCVDDEGREGVCVLHYQCQPNSRSLIKDGATILDVRENNACPNVLEVCCMNMLTTGDNSVVSDSKKENAPSSAPNNKICSLFTLFVALEVYRRI